MPSRPNSLRALALCGAAALALAGCREEAAPQTRLQAHQEPLFVPADAAQAVYAQPAAPVWQEPLAAPSAPTQVVARDNGYAYAERAYALDNAFYEAPPDYGFAYEGEEPWAWRTQDDYQMYAEPIDGGFRYYYYEPGADYPYFVRDPDYGYGYAPGGVLVSLYSSAGLLLPHAYLSRYGERAGSYRVRAHRLREAAYHAPRLRVDDRAWRSRRPAFDAGRDRWMQAAVRQKDWRQYREREGSRDLRRFAPERERRVAAQNRPGRDLARPDVRGERSFPSARPDRDRGGIDRARPDRRRPDGAEAFRAARAEHPSAPPPIQQVERRHAGLDARQGHQARLAQDHIRGEGRRERPRFEREAQAQQVQPAQQAPNPQRAERAGRPDQAARMERRAERPERAGRRDGAERAAQQPRAERPERRAEAAAPRPERRPEAAAPRPEREARAPQERQRPDRAEGRPGGGGHGGGRQMRND